MVQNEYKKDNINNYTEIKLINWRKEIMKMEIKQKKKYIKTTQEMTNKKCIQINNKS